MERHITRSGRPNESKEELQRIQNDLLKQVRRARALGAQLVRLAAPARVQLACRQPRALSRGQRAGGRMGGSLVCLRSTSASSEGARVLQRVRAAWLPKAQRDPIQRRAQQRRAASPLAAVPGKRPSKSRESGVRVRASEAKAPARCSALSRVPVLLRLLGAPSGAWSPRALPAPARAHAHSQNGQQSGQAAPPSACTASRPPRQRDCPGPRTGS